MGASAGYSVACTCVTGGVLFNVILDSGLHAVKKQLKVKKKRTIAT